MSDNDTKMTEPMSKEEMIDILKGLVFGTFDRTTAKEREALDMAIKILEQQSILDKIGDEILEYIDDLDIAAEICDIFDKYKEGEGV